MRYNIIKMSISVCLTVLIMIMASPLNAKIEGRTPTGGANVTTRKCVGGTNAGALCNDDSVCNSGDCFDYNIFDLSVNLLEDSGAGWTPSTAQLTTIEGYFEDVNDAIHDVTDGQVVLGTISLIVDNGAPNAVVQLFAGECSVSGAVCLTNGDCTGGAGDTCDSRGGAANTGDWGASGHINIGVNCLANPLCVAHEFMHLVANVRDEYQGALDDGVDNNANGQIDECGENQSNSRCFGGTNDGQPCANAAQCPGGACRRIVCIDPGSPAVPGCLMRCCLADTGSELCHAGNHDPDIDTEQSQCRNNNDCWTQFALEWPTVIQAPAGAPDPGPAAAPNTVAFLTPSVLDRFVAVVDRSGTMGDESPRRIDVAITAVKDFIDLLSDGTDFGLASFSYQGSESDPPDVDSTKDFPSVPGLRSLAGSTDRDDAKDAVDDLSGRVGGRTRIGAGLLKARDMLLEAGGTVTLNTTVLLLTDGLNNEPANPGPTTDLNNALNQLAADSIPVFVSCIGEARDSTQCSYIADRTAGRFVDSVETDSLYDAFVEFAAEAQGLGISRSEIGRPISEGETSAPIYAKVEAGAATVRFVVTWTKAGTDLDLDIYPPGSTTPIDPSQKTQASQGEFYLLENPAAGTWTMRVIGTSVPDSGDKFSARALIDHTALSVEASLAKSTVEYPEGFLISVHPSRGLSITGCQVSGLVEKPDGSTETIHLYDNGRYGDSEAGNGLYQVDYRNFTGGEGIYTFILDVLCDDPQFFIDEEPGFKMRPYSAGIGAFERTIRLSGIVTGVPDNLPPVAEICADVRAECTGALTPVGLDGTCSSDPEGQALSYSWSSPTGTFSGPTAKPTGSFQLGRNDVTLVVSDPGGASSAPYDGLVVIADTIAPEINCPANVVIECDQSTDPDNTGKPVVVEDCDQNPGVSHSDVVTAGDCPQEETIVRTWSATDVSGNSASCTQTIEVVDTTAPVISCNAPPTITPPDAPISFAATATDNCENNPLVEVTGFNCYALTKKDKRIDKTDSCVAEAAGANFTILDSGGVGDTIDWTVRAADACGNTVETTCSLEVINPGLP